MYGAIAGHWQVVAQGKQGLVHQEGEILLRILVLGGAGMLGHKLFQALPDKFETYVTLRQSLESYSRYGLFDPARTIDHVSVNDFGSVARVIGEVQPHIVFNCIGIVKQREEAKAAIPSILVNSLFPHQLADLCQSRGIRLVHVSTDCVFSGDRGTYTEGDPPDPVDLYGRTKLLGELDRPGCLTLRTSIIGWELEHRTSLLEWFATQRGHTIKGYRGAIYTGVCTSALAGLMGTLVEKYPDLTGLYHLTSHPITKYDLLVGLQETLGWHDIAIEPDDTFRCDRSLVGTRFQTITGFHPPTWDEMIASLAAEWPVYQRWREKVPD